MACFAPLVAGRDYMVLVFTVPLAFLLAWGCYKTGYEVKADYLIIYSGPLKKKILITDIKNMKQTKNPLASYALSIDRLEIIYASDFNMALISPKDKDSFIKLVKKVNLKSI
ncbi:PH domain-containing protein [Viridibacillus arvi]|uniref:PH domain-containing protein n=1 Tax=Viridibacillus arvi TaxID=263475 RepID=UPI003D077FC2